MLRGMAFQSPGIRVSGRLLGKVALNLPVRDSRLAVGADHAAVVPDVRLSPEDAQIALLLGLVHRAQDLEDAVTGLAVVLVQRHEICSAMDEVPNLSELYVSRDGCRYGGGRPAQGLDEAGALDLPFENKDNVAA